MDVMGDFFNKFNAGASDFVTPGKQLEYISKRKPDAAAIIYIDKEQNRTEITWADLNERANQLAWLLTEHKVGAGTVVLVSYPNGIEHMIAAFAIWRTGACYLPISSKTTGPELAQICRIIAPVAAFSDMEVPGVLYCLGTADLDTAIRDMQRDALPDVEANPNMISLSGGTSGKLKFIRQNAACGLTDDIIRKWFGMSGMEFEQRQLLVGPLFHGAPHSAAFNGLFAGNTLVIPRNLCPDNIVSLIKEYQIEFVQMVPTLMNRIARLPGISREDFASVKALCHTGGFCSPWLKQTWIHLLSPNRIYEIYAMTEVIGLTCIRGDEWLKHYGSIGLPIGPGRISIRDKDGAELAPYEVGDIYMTAPSDCFMTEYINQEPLEVKSGGYRSVGDIGYVDGDGYLYFLDRRSDMPVIGGENVFVTEVEAALLRHRAVADAVVVGIPDEEWGRRLHALIEPAGDINAEELQTFLGRWLSPYKIPRTYEFVSCIKRGDNGKADREQILNDCIARGV